MAAKIVIKPLYNAITSAISQSLFYAEFAITSDNIITVLNNNIIYFMCAGLIMAEECGEECFFKDLVLTFHTIPNL